MSIVRIPILRLVAMAEKQVGGWLRREILLARGRREGSRHYSKWLDMSRFLIVTP